MKSNRGEHKRVSVYLHKDKHRRLKSKLALEEKSVSGWFRQVIDEFLAEVL